MVLIRFVKDWDGHRLGDEVSVGAGLADAYLNHSRAAVEVDAQELNLPKTKHNGLDAVTVGATEVINRFKGKRKKGRK